MKYSIDLHIHSALSPCAANDMTPNNIVNMAALKGLDIIAVTDHNSILNCEAVAKCGLSRDILVIPGMELETSEEVHVLCLFPTINQARELQAVVDCALPKLENPEDIFGKQLLYDEFDRIAGCEKRLLLTAVQINLHDVVRLVTKIGGVVIPAHINRHANSIISNLGMIPHELGFSYVELTYSVQKHALVQNSPDIDAFNFIYSSDAHHLGDILERTCFIELESLSPHCLIETLQK